MISNSPDTLDGLNRELVDCRRCPRLVEWRERIAAERRAAFKACEYWGRPVPNFGDPSAERLIVGLAPAAHGANRTGRMFTGDRSGDFLFGALYRAGVANRPEATSVSDGLSLTGVLISAAVHCAPPGNKPTPEEFANCRDYLRRLFDAGQWRGVLCLGAFAWRETLQMLRTSGRLSGGIPRFGHGAEVDVDGIRVLGSYHPSQQNTFTGRLTGPMFDAVIRRFLA